MLAHGSVPAMVNYFMLSIMRHILKYVLFYFGCLCGNNVYANDPISHRLQLGNIGFDITKKDGAPAGISDMKDIRQELNV